MVETIELNVGGQRPFGILTKWVTARTPSGRAP